MSKRIDPIRHWSIIVFIAIAVVVGIVLLPILARIFRFSLEGKPFTTWSALAWHWQFLLLLSR